LGMKAVAALDVVRTQLANGIAVTTTTHTGTVNVIQTPGTFRNLRYTPNEGSVSAGPGSSLNSSWAALSLSTYNGNILSKDTGGRPMILPFVDATAAPI